MSPIITNPTVQAAVASVVALPLLFASFVLFEPALAVGQTSSDEFTIEQTINNEIAFTAQPQNVVMDTALTGLTGGTSNGSTTFSVATNNPNGYTVGIRFDDTGSTGCAMRYNSDNTVCIGNGPSSVSFDLDPPASNQPAEFAYTVDSAYAEQTFLSDGVSACNDSGGSTNGERCFLMQSSIATDEIIMRRTEASAGGSGDSMDLYFRVVVGQDPNPVLPSGTYTATATLTATEL